MKRPGEFLPGVFEEWERLNGATREFDARSGAPHPAHDADTVSRWLDVSIEQLTETLRLELEGRTGVIPASPGPTD
jgi:hypothetical protein